MEIIITPDGYRLEVADAAKALAVLTRRVPAQVQKPTANVSQKKVQKKLPNKRLNVGITKFITEMATLHGFDEPLCIRDVVAKCTNLGFVFEGRKHDREVAVRTALGHRHSQ